MSHFVYYQLVTMKKDFFKKMQITFERSPGQFHPHEEPTLSYPKQIHIRINLKEGEKESNLLRSFSCILTTPVWISLITNPFFVIPTPKFMQNANAPQVIPVFGP